MRNSINRFCKKYFSNIVENEEDLFVFSHRILPSCLCPQTSGHLVKVGKTNTEDESICFDIKFWIVCLQQCCVKINNDV